MTFAEQVDKRTSKNTRRTPAVTAVQICLVHSASAMTGVSGLAVVYGASPVV